MKECLVHIYAADGRSLGAGVYLGDKKVLTCAHLFANDHGVKLYGQDIRECELRFPLLDKGRSWKSEGVVSEFEGNRDIDLALVTLEGEPSFGAVPAKFADSVEDWRVDLYGFPGSHSTGIDANADVKKPDVRGWLRLQAVSCSGDWVTKGWSGSPVWHAATKTVFGILTATDEEPNHFNAWMIPTRTLVSVLKRWGIKPETATCSPRNRYVLDLHERTARIRIHGFDDGKVLELPMDDIYIPLAKVADDKDLKRERDPNRRVELHEALKERRLTILGRPGAGKTTFTRRVVHALCNTWLKQEDQDCVTAKDPGLTGQPFPVLIKLAELARSMTNSATTPACIVAFLKEKHPGVEEWGEVLRSGNAMVFFDGLDEVPDQQRAKMTRLIECAGGPEWFSSARFVVTCRPPAYRDNAVLSGFSIAEIADLSDEDIARLLDNWCKRLPNLQDCHRATYRGELEQALKEKPEIRRMSRNPVMLTALATVHRSKGELPEQRAALYDAIVDHLLEARHKDEDGESAGQRKTRRRLYEELAFAMQNGKGGPQDAMHRETAENELEAIWKRTSDETATSPNATNFLAHELVCTGILVPSGDNVEFWHATFREFLAACALARPDRKPGVSYLSPDKLYSPQWREVVLLLGGMLWKWRPNPTDRDQTDQFFTQVLDTLKPNAKLNDVARCVGLLGSVLNDLSTTKFKEPSDPRWSECLNRVMDLFDARKAKGIAIEDALSAVEALGEGSRNERDKNWIEIPAGAFVMGVQEEAPKGRNYEYEAGSDEGPPHEVILSAYKIGKYPVTVFEYKLFVKDDGYLHDEYWKQGRIEGKDSPENWDEQLKYPNRPVVGVSWFEATAYTAWVSAMWPNCRLPTEAEWEYAAGGIEGRKYQWGNEPEPDPSRLNYDGSKIGHATPVGLYPLGATPEGVLDMVGNVWEWCQDWEGVNSANKTGDPTGPSSGPLRVLRGGSWCYFPSYCRSANRTIYPPQFRCYFIGFRCCCSLICLREDTPA